MARSRVLVTGAFSYTGAFTARELLRRGATVSTLTSHPRRPGAWAEAVEAHPYSFDDPAALRRSLQGVDVLVNTYWIRFPRNGIGYGDAVENIRILAEAAAEAGVGRIVHVSVSNPSHDSPFPYYRGKAQAEDVVRRAGPAWAIARPTWLVGGQDILLNNVAWLLRRLPAFGLPGDGRYLVQPVTAADVGRVLADLAQGDEEAVRDVAGPETLTFRDVVRKTLDAIGKRRLVVPVPAWLAATAARAVGPLVGDVVLTRDELGGLMAGLLASREPPLGREGFSEWVKAHGADLGRRYHSEVERHFRGVDPAPFRRAA